MANVFRHIFQDQLEEASLDRDLELNLLEYTVGPSTSPSGSIGGLTVGETVLVGLGAIGNAAIWTLRRFEDLRGTLTLVDHENIELSNLQRYVLATTDAVGRSKVEWAAASMTLPHLVIRTAGMKWAQYLDGSDWRLPRLAIAVDTVEERIRMSGALAGEVLNAWTQTDEAGISRHQKYGEDACLACLYFPQGTVPSEDALIGASIRLPGEAVRDLLHTGRAVGPAFIAQIAASLGINPDLLMRFQTKSLRQFYSEVVCGGIIFRLGAGSQLGTEVPMAFQSALAGVFLAAEIVISANEFRAQAIPCVSRVQTLRPVAGVVSTPVGIIAKCMCQDPSFRAAFSEKFSTVS